MQQGSGGALLFCTAAASSVARATTEAAHRGRRPVTATSAERVGLGRRAEGSGRRGGVEEDSGAAGGDAHPATNRLDAGAARRGSRRGRWWRCCRGEPTSVPRDQQPKLGRFSTGADRERDVEAAAERQRQILASDGGVREFVRVDRADPAGIRDHAVFEHAGEQAAGRERMAVEQGGGAALRAKLECERARAGERFGIEPRGCRSPQRNSTGKRAVRAREQRAVRRVQPGAHSAQRRAPTNPAARSPSANSSGKPSRCPSGKSRDEQHGGRTRIREDGTLALALVGDDTLANRSRRSACASMSRSVPSRERDIITTARRWPACGRSSRRDSRQASAKTRSRCGARPAFRYDRGCAVLVETVASSAATSSMAKSVRPGSGPPRPTPTGGSACAHPAAPPHAVRPSSRRRWCAGVPPVARRGRATRSCGARFRRDESAPRRLLRRAPHRSPPRAARRSRPGHARRRSAPQHHRRGCGGHTSKAGDLSEPSSEPSTAPSSP